jgi:hypothetical protein
VGSRLAKRSMADAARALRAGADTGEKCSRTSGEEGGVVVRGRIELTVGGEIAHLGAGRCLLFPQLAAASISQSGTRGMRNRQRELAADVLAGPRPVLSLR